MENELTAAEVELHREHAISNSLEDRLTQLREEQASEHVEQEVGAFVGLQKRLRRREIATWQRSTRT